MNYIEYYGPNADGIPEDMIKRIFITDSDVDPIPGTVVPDRDLDAHFRENKARYDVLRNRVIEPGFIEGMIEGIKDWWNT